MVTQEQKDKLIQAGYTVEDMGAAWGREWIGQYRWLNAAVEGDGFGYPQLSEDEAWASAARHASVS
jgi:hypothetical protein